jgi:hypothetical protein
MKLIQELLFPNYPTEIKISDGSRATYYKKSDKIPKKYIGLSFETYKGKEVLVDMWGIPIVKNSNNVDKPKYHRINGQDLYSLNILPHIKNNIVKTIKEYYNSFNYKYKKENSGVFIEYIFYCKELKSDLDNHSLFYHKTFLDSIQKYVFIGRGEKELNSNYIIDNDKVDYVNGYSINFCKLNNKFSDNNYLLISIYSNDNQTKLEKLKRILNKEKDILIYLL